MPESPLENSPGPRPVEAAGVAPAGAANASPRPPGKPISAWSVLKRAVREWNADNAPRLGASLAFYTALSMAPLLVLSLRIAARIFGNQAARQEIERQAQVLIGPQGAEAIRAMLESANQAHDGMVATVISVATLLFGASAVFGELQGSFNIVWNVPPDTRRGWTGWLALVWQRLVSFAMVMAIAFLLLVSLVVSAGLSVAERLLDRLPDSWQIVDQILAFGVSTAIITILFTTMFKILPDTETAWRDVWFGGLVTALLFSIGKWGIGLYLGHSAIASGYGAAGSFVVLLVWIYYSAQIVLFGAELTQAYSAVRAERAAAAYREPGS